MGADAAMKIYLWVNINKTKEWGATLDEVKNQASQVFCAKECAVIPFSAKSWNTASNESLARSIVWTPTIGHNTMDMIEKRASEVSAHPSNGKIIHVQLV